MTKEEIIKAVVCEVKDYRFTHEELMRMSKKELLQYYPQFLTLIDSTTYKMLAQKICSKI